jgi:predicted component of type VI protein secretion system
MSHAARVLALAGAFAVVGCGEHKAVHAKPTRVRVDLDQEFNPYRTGTSRTTIERVPVGK